MPIFKNILFCNRLKVVGVYLEKKPKALLFKLAKSENLWDRRIAIVSTLQFIRNENLKPTFALVDILINDSEDLMHKACGWMLREAGKKDQKALEAFLKIHSRKMPRTMLRYAIEKFPESKRQFYLKSSKGSIHYSSLDARHVKNASHKRES